MLRSKKIDAYRLKLLLKHLNGDIIDNIFFKKKKLRQWHIRLTHVNHG